ncbi:MAG TPA: ATP synthase F1 subunit gamma [Bacillota bacterium]|jgi:F-type H+-transporting ATPase subunit gamma|nr:ATP synthase F1 subunit gamma [Bacillota bacterium]HOL09794.1 ATP synthase F1 subunit gamma [Bacillota bacterium]HPO97340.1 ATP synthase F1 subunit gamma [Bacillota bacterium]
MSNIRDLKLRINSVKNIQHITKAMKLVAAARLRKAQERLESARPYARKMAEVTSDLASLTLWSFNPLLRPHQYLNRTLIVIFTGDRGLAGGFHQKIADEAVKFGKKLSSKNKVYNYIIGNKGERWLRQHNVPIYRSFEQPVAGVSFNLAQILAQELIALYLQEEFDKIYLYYAKFYSALEQRPRAFQLLPIDPSQAQKKESSGLFIFEPGRKEMLDSILPRYIESEIFRAFLETEAGEIGARMTAMSAATDNADEIIAEYELEFNRLRQTQITAEIAEIVGGAEVLGK